MIYGKLMNPHEFANRCANASAPADGAGARSGVTLKEYKNRQIK